MRRFAALVPLPFARPRLALAVLGLAAGLGGCVGPLPLSSPGPLGRGELEALWSDYSALPEERALAIAGELRRNQWVAGASGGHATRAEAVGAALRECERRRAARGMVDACRLYGVGDEVLSSGARAGSCTMRGRK